MRLWLVIQGQKNIPDFAGEEKTLWGEKGPPNGSQRNVRITVSRRRRWSEGKSLAFSLPRGRVWVPAPAGRGDDRLFKIRAGGG